MPFQQKTSSKYTCRPRRVDNVIQSIASLVEHDPYVDHALLCNATTPYISKLPGDGCGAGHLCGYYNAQMLLSTLTGTTDSENEALSLLVKNGIPDILSLQRQLEHAWDSGIDPHRRELIGPVASTSKHIGTAEVYLPNDPSHVFLTHMQKGSGHPRVLEGAILCRILRDNR